MDVTRANQNNIRLNFVTQEARTPQILLEYMRGTYRSLNKRAKLRGEVLAGAVGVQNQKRSMGWGGEWGSDDEAFDLQMILRKYMCCLLQLLWGRTKENLRNK